MNINVRRQTPEDAEEVYQLFRTTWLATYPNEEHGITVEDIEAHMPKTLSAEALEKRKAYVRDLPDEKYMVVARSGGGIVGVCGGEKTDAYNQMRSIYVLPEYQGKGVGQALWDAFYRWVDKNKKTIVHVATYNEQAIKFYRKQGFVDTGKRFTEERHTFKSGSQIPEMEMELPLYKQSNQMLSAKD